jgi:RHS repeat-associated protein
MEKGLPPHSRRRRRHGQPTRRRRETARSQNSPINQSRWYDSTIGKWLSQDPLGPAPDSNPYRYCGNGPTNAVDPTGEGALESLVADAILKALDVHHNGDALDVLKAVVEDAANNAVVTLVELDLADGHKRPKTRFVRRFNRNVDVYTGKLCQGDSVTEGVLHHDAHALARELGIDVKALELSNGSSFKITPPDGKEVTGTLVSSGDKGVLEYTAVVDRQNKIQFMHWTYKYYVTYTVSVPGNASDVTVTQYVGVVQGVYVVP